MIRAHGESYTRRAERQADHFIYWKDGIPEIINIQPNRDKAKAYQVRQIRAVILKYHLEV